MRIHSATDDIYWDSNFSTENPATKHDVNDPSYDSWNFISVPAKLEKYVEETMEYYNNRGFLYINPVLRGERKSNKKIDDAIAKMDRIISVCRTKNNLILYRGSGSYLDNANEGDTLHDKAFLSTSLDPSIATGEFSPSGRYLALEYPLGFPAIPGSWNEHEVVLPRSLTLQIYEIIGKEYRAIVVENGMEDCGEATPFSTR